jgi:acyl carrier protein
MSDLTERLVNLLSEQVGVDEDGLRAEATFDELELDSLVLIEFSLILKKEFGVVLEDGELTPDLTVQRTAKLLETKGVTV